LSAWTASGTARVVPFAVFVLFIAIEQLTGFFAPDWGWDTRWIYPVKTLVVVACLGWYWRTYRELRIEGPYAPSTWLLALFAGAGVFLLWINLEWASLTDAGGYNPLDAGGNVEMSLVAFRLAGATLLVPVTEELFWRSFLLRWLERQDFLSVDPQRLGVRALVLSSIFFALEHNMWLAGLIAGLAYGWLYVRTGKLWIPIVAHGTTNGLLGVWVLRTQQWQFW
jgi:uncharacterized protein